ncbi:hypothetical protein L3X38_029211 [Prunus dulcis]|uniref:Uncharacterized protein n=1 Tax=Prunus dulcis TaxID=3755 RepID=A0AAD4Z271_PRUDU|nr:hypothetical protein L3X38_029211 [Prunus dulcis]
MSIASQLSLSKFRKATNDLLVAEETLNEAMNTAVSHHKFFIKSVEDLRTLLQLAKRAKWNGGSVNRTVSFDRKNQDIKNELQANYIKDEVTKMKLKMVPLSPRDYKE